MGNVHEPQRNGAVNFVIELLEAVIHISRQEGIWIPDGEHRDHLGHRSPGIYMQFARSILTVYFNRIVHKLLNVICYARFVKRNVRHNCFVLSFYRAANKLDSRPKRPCPSAAVTLITVASRANARLTTYPGKGHNTAFPEGTAAGRAATVPPELAGTSGAQNSCRFEISGQAFASSTVSRTSLAVTVGRRRMRL